MNAEIIKISIAGEGPTDCGTKEWDGTLHEGPVITFIRRIAADADCEFTLFTRSELRNMRKPGYQRRLKELDKQQIQALFLADRAADDEFDLAVFFSDSDNPGHGRNTDDHACRKNYDELKVRLMHALELGTQGRPLKVLAVIAVKMIESWIMSDPESFKELWGNGQRVDFPAHPELEWGDRNDPESNFPKNRLDCIMSAFNQESGPDTYNMIAEISDLEEIAAKCPIGFRTFKTELETILDQIFDQR